MQIMCDEFPIPDFPFNDSEKLNKMVKDWQKRSAGGLFEKCVGAFDGCLLRTLKACVNARKVSNPSKYMCRKGFWSVNCQVCCDSQRRVTWMSMSHPGACPDITAYKQSVMCRAIEADLLPNEFYFIGDNAYPCGKHMLTPFNKHGLKTDPKKRDSYNFYLSQLRIHIECVFGILVNRFPILQQELKCRLLENAILTFRTCVCLHNLLVDRRVDAFPGSEDSVRLTQVPNHKRVSVPEFHEVPECNDNTNVEECTTTFAVGLNDEDVDDSDEHIDRRDQHVQKIYQAGCVRPKVTKWQRLSLQLPTV